MDKNLDFFFATLFFMVKEVNENKTRAYRLSELDRLLVRKTSLEL